MWLKNIISSFLLYSFLGSNQLDYATNLFSNIKTITDKNTTVSSLPSHTSSNTSTQAYLGIDELNQLVKHTWADELNLFSSIINQTKENEKKYSSEYYVFYHGQRSSFLPYLDFITNIYELLEMRKLTHFTFLRFWPNALTSVETNSFIDEYENEHNDYWNDNNLSLSNKIMSINLSLFGNTNKLGESSFAYFVQDRSICPPSIEYLYTTVFDYFCFNHDYITQLLQLDYMTFTGKGTLFQIFVPKEKVNSFIYLAWVYGEPYRIPIISTIFNYIKNRHIRIKDILEKYRHQPESIENLDRLQGRIIFSKDTMLNPDSGIKTFTFTALSPSDKQDYTAQLETITKDVFIDWIADKSYLTNQQISNSKLVQFIKKQVI